MKKLVKILTRESTPEATTEPTKHKKSTLKLQQKFMNEIIATEKDINGEIILNYLKYQNPSLFTKDLIRSQQAKN